MGCKCQEKKQDPNETCSDAQEESFRIAFLAESKKTSRYSAQVKHLEDRLDYVGTSSKKAVGQLQSLLAKTEMYLMDLLDEIPAHQRKGLLDKLGAPPVSLKVSSE